MLKEGHQQDKYGAGTVGTATSNSPEDSNIGAHNIENADILKRVNAFVGSIADREYLKPEAALAQLEARLGSIGVQLKDSITIDNKK